MPYNNGFNPPYLHHNENLFFYYKFDIFWQFSGVMSNTFWFNFFLAPLIAGDLLSWPTLETHKQDNEGEKVPRKLVIKKKVLYFKTKLHHLLQMFWDTETVFSPLTQFLIGGFRLLDHIKPQQVSWLNLCFNMSVQLFIITTTSSVLPDHLFYFNILILRQVRVTRMHTNCTFFFPISKWMYNI